MSITEMTELVENLQVNLSSCNWRMPLSTHKSRQLWYLRYCWLWSLWNVAWRFYCPKDLMGTARSSVVFLSNAAFCSWCISWCILITRPRWGLSVLLTSEVPDWASVLEQASPILTNIDKLVHIFSVIFSYPTAFILLMPFGQFLRQGHQTILAYAAHFQHLVANMAWNKAAQIAISGRVWTIM